ncbi:MAG: glycerol-3-phosphate dehydrogenase [Pseudomonadota bacterium]
MQAWSEIMTDFDVFVIGGGINGCGIARDAAGRGYSVCLAEMNDLASGTSSWSTKLIHGGLRYLEYYEFRLVREALMERERLWSIAPHIIWPMRFVLPHNEGTRPKWLVRTGLFLYDNIGGRKKLPSTRVLDLRKDPAGKPLKPGYSTAFEYSDCWVNDARLVVLNAMDAEAKGARIATRTKVTGLERKDGAWAVTIQDTVTGTSETVSAKLVVNAAGPWVDAVLTGSMGKNTKNVRLVQGSHIVIRKKFDDERAYFFQNADGRIMFAIPYENDFTLIGTTDQDYDGDPSDVKITPEETKYLCDGASQYFAEPVTEDDIVWTYSGVRPLYDDGASKAQEATRDYVLKEVGGEGESKLINIFGGKITTYRKLAESVLELVENNLGEKGASWTGTQELPGGGFTQTGFDREVVKLAASYPFLSATQAKRFMRLYGTRAYELLADAKSEADLGAQFGASLTAREIDYLMDHEFALTADDVLWRRTKLGLHIHDAKAVAALETYMQKRANPKKAA